MHLRGREGCLILWIPPPHLLPQGDGDEAAQLAHACRIGHPWHGFQQQLLQVSAIVQMGVCQLLV